MSTSACYLVIGGGLAAKEAVKAIRKADADGAITMVGDEPHLPYDRPPLTKAYLQGESSRDDLAFETPAFYADNRIETILGTAVTALDPKSRTATLADGRQLSYTKALLATGGRPVRLPIPGADAEGVFYLRTVDDANAIAGAAGKGKRVVLIGAGFIGLEMAASLTGLGCSVTVVEAGPHIWARFADEQLAGYFQQQLEQRGVAFRTNARVEGITGDGRADGVKLQGGETLPADFVCIGIGIRPNVELAQEAGLEVDNGIVVDAQLRTSDPDIYAAGDIVNYPDAVFGKRRRVEHWSHANFSGRLAGGNMAGGDKTYDFLSFVWSDIFDLHLRFVGDHGEHEQQIVRGAWDGGPLSIFYLRGGRVTGAFSINADPREGSLVRRLILGNVDVSGRLDELADPEVALKSLMA